MKEKVWRLYLRFSMQWFTPCKQCQEKIQEDFKEELNKAVLFAVSGYAYHVSHYVLCNKCKKKIIKLLEDADIIIGNKQYEPLVEISRR